MFAIWVTFHVIVCFALIVVVLMQSSKGEGLAGTSFSGGISGAVFGGRGAAGFLSKATTVLAVVFMVNCGALALMSARTRTVVASDAAGQQPATTESAVTRQAQKDLQEAAARQAQAQQRTAQDSAAKVSGNKAEVDFAKPADSGKK